MLIFVIFFPLTFSGLITITIHLCVQLLQFSTDYNAILQAYSTCSEDVRLILGLSALYFLLIFFSTFSTKFFFQVLLVLE